MEIPELDSVLSPTLIAAYRAARYRVVSAQPVVLVVGRNSPGLEALMEQAGCAQAAFLTAWNPYSTPLRKAENDRRQERLLRDLQARGHRWIEAFGDANGGEWPGEASVLALGVNRHVACELGRRHEQNAVLWSGADAIPRLILLR